MVTAVAPGAGALGINEIGGGTNAVSDFTACQPSQPVSVLQIHGTADPLVPYSLQQPSLALMAMRNGCATATRPASAPASAGDTQCVTYDGCPRGIALTGCTVQDGGHCWFGSEDCGTGGGAIGLAIVGANSDTMHNTNAAWSFFEPLAR
jgi:polyhydroxybutyrate depolymerase